MKFGLFFGHQLPRPWEEDAEYRIIHDSLEEIELAEKLGFDVVWQVEHHFMEEYSHCSAPEMILAAASQRTSRIRLGHGIMAMPPKINPPARVAERIATLDLLSGGRVEFGTGETASEVELGGFNVDRATKKAAHLEAVNVVARMFVETPFAGHEGVHVSAPPRNVIPKVMQRPHPPIWTACSRRESILGAARMGTGVLSFAFIDPTEANEWVGQYYRILESEECIPAGFAVNANFATVAQFMCHKDEATAIERGKGVQFMTYALSHYYMGIDGGHVPGRTSVWDLFEENKDSFAERSQANATEHHTLGKEQIQEQGLDALRGAVGTPDQVRAMLRSYQDAGIDQVILMSQAGKNRHEHICESLELFAKEVMPEFKEHEEEREKEKMERLGPVLEAAMARREPPRQLADGYAIFSPS
jgi:alkanesulfonate monooxygenase SsuD/methylene tetrahydromethanopterin reductase-like flavin-dependent oxidoreductase (luciferase family)